MRVVKSDFIPYRSRPGKTTTVTNDWAQKETGGHAALMQRRGGSSGEEGRREMKRGRKLRRSS